LCSTIDDFDADLIYGKLGFRILPNIYLGVTWTWCPSNPSGWGYLDKECPSNPGGWGYLDIPCPSNPSGWGYLDMMAVYMNSMIFKLKQLEAFGLTSSYQSDV